VIPLRAEPNRPTSAPMRNSDRKQDDGIELVPVPMGPETRARLVAFARAVGKPPAEAAGALLNDLLEDQDFWDAAADAGSRAIN
jgi:hypothetical protein